MGFLFLFFLGLASALFFPEMVDSYPVIQDLILSPAGNLPLFPVCDAQCLASIHAVCLLQAPPIVDPEYYGIVTVCSKAYVVGVGGFIASGLQVLGNGIGAKVAVNTNSSVEVALKVGSPGVAIDQIEFHRGGDKVGVFVRVKTQLYYFILMTNIPGAIECLGLDAHDSELEALKFAEGSGGWGLFLHKTSQCGGV